MNYDYRMLSLRLWGLVLSGGLMLGGLAGLLGENTTNPPARLKLDETPLAREIREATSLSPIVKKASPSVVSVYTTKYVQQRSPQMMNPFWYFFGGPEGDEPQEGRRRPVEGLGSGVILTEDGYLLTNNHVVDQVDEVKVVLGDGKTEYDARVVGKDDQTDVAVLKVEARNLPAITLADSEKLEVGDMVLAIGNPFGVGQTVTKGLVSAKGRSGFYMLRYEDFIQTDASINPGNSGGALVDAQGRLVGINTLIFSRSGGSAGVGFAIPSNLAREVMDQIIREGKVVRGYLGVELELEISKDLVKEFELPNDQGALVTKVLPGGPAGRAGVKAGDFIVAFNGRTVTDRRSLQFQVARTKPETKVPVKLIREGKERALQITVGELNLRETADAGPGVGVPGGDTLQGVELADLSPALRRQYRIPNSVEGGVLVTQVDPESRAHSKGLRPGCVVLEVNRQAVQSTQDVDAALEKSGSGRVLLRVLMPSRVVQFMVIDPKTGGE